MLYKMCCTKCTVRNVLYKMWCTKCAVQNVLYKVHKIYYNPKSISRLINCNMAHTLRFKNAKLI
jgi:hypothetical protein